MKGSVVITNHSQDSSSVEVSVAMPAACSELATWRARRRSSFDVWPLRWELGSVNIPGSFWGHMGSNVRSARLLVWKGNGLLVVVPWNNLRMIFFQVLWKPSHHPCIQHVISFVSWMMTFYFNQGARGRGSFLRHHVQQHSESRAHRLAVAWKDSV